MNPEVRARRAWVIDWAIAVGFTVAVMLITRKIQDSDEEGRLLNWLGYACIAFVGLPLGFRRRAPLPVLAVTTVAILVYTGFHFPGGPVYLGPIIAMSTLGEPAFVATREEVAAFFRNTAESSWADAAGTVALLGLVALTWFMVGLCLLLGRAEGQPPWRSTVALVFGALFAAYLFTDSSWDAASNRGADLDPGLAHFAFDMGNIGFANAWVTMGSFAAFAGWAVLTTGVFRRWLGLRRSRACFFTVRTPGGRARISGLRFMTPTAC